MFQRIGRGNSRHVYMKIDIIVRDWIAKDFNKNHAHKYCYEKAELHGWISFMSLSPKGGSQLKF